jgi:hypothetical protein
VALGYYGDVKSDGLFSMIQDVLRGGYNLKSPGSLRSLGIFICQLSKASFARRQIKIPHNVQDFFTRAQDRIPCLPAGRPADRR